MKKSPLKTLPTVGGVAASVVLTLVVLLALFGDSVRTLSGMSANALAGEPSVEKRTTRSKGDALEKKRLSNFGQSNEWYGHSPVATGNTHEAVAPNPVTTTDRDALSTFAIDVDSASYSLARRQLTLGRLPAPASVRVEEWVNAFRYELAAPKDAPFAVSAEGAPSPFDPERTLLKVSLQGRRISNEARKPVNLVFLVDTSCSMSGADRLQLAKTAMRTIVDNLREDDRVAIATYAGETQLKLASTGASRRGAILSVIDSLTAAGGTAMGSGMELAYQEAVRGVKKGVTSRVMVFTDGDANIGNVTADQMLDSVKGHVADGVTLTTVGFGMGNLRDNTLERLADRGNGQSLYVDTPTEAERVFGARGLPGTLEVIAKDVKVQVAFDSSVVRSYRLVGYENRAVADEDFRNDDVDGGELGAGHSVTAMYELELTGQKGPLATVTVRGHQPERGTAFEVVHEVTSSALARDLREASADLRFATGVVMAADVMRGSLPATSLPMARELAASASSDWPERREFVKLLDAALAAPVGSQYVYNGY